MKKVICEDELYKKMQEAIHLLCDPVKSTLGPKGNNVIIDHSTLSPFITNDGVTIAENIESEDETVNTILELAKEASIKTNDTVGDGTTTTLVLLENLFNEGLNLIKSGKNAIVLKKEMDNSLENVIELLKKERIEPKGEMLKSIASISSNDEFVGKIIYEVFSKTGTKDAITISESDKEETYVSYLSGYSLPINAVSDYYYKEKDSVELLNCHVLLVNNVINDINEIGNIINFINENNSSLIIIANDYSDNMINDSLNLLLNEFINIYLFKISEYGKRQISILKDLEVLTDSHTLNSLEYVSLNDLGTVKKISFDSKKMTIDFEQNEQINKRIDEIKCESVENTLDEDFINKRISMFNNGLAIIYVGARTDTERKELKMRYVDALCSINSAKTGIIPGGGVTFLKISNLLSDASDGNSIIKEAMKKPIWQILYNAGCKEDVISKIIESDYKFVYNIKTEKLESIKETIVFDSLEVSLNAIKNACSIASMLLTTKYLVINEQNLSHTMINDYSEL